MTKLPKCMPRKGKIISEDHILEWWDYYVTITTAENKIFMKEVGKQTFDETKRAKGIGKKGGTAKKRQPRTPTYNRYVYNA